MAENDVTVVSSGEDREKVVPLWLRRIASTNLFSSCETHLSEERRFYCTVCMVALCQVCQTRHYLCGHKMIQAYKLFKEASFKMEDLKSLWNTYDIRPYKCRHGLIAYVYSRGALFPRSQGKSGGAVCESCEYQFRALGFKFCSVECKVEALMKMNEGGSMKSGAKRKVETISEENACNVQSSRKQPRK